LADPSCVEEIVIWKTEITTGQESVLMVNESKSGWLVEVGR